MATTAATTSTTADGAQTVPTATLWRTGLIASAAGAVANLAFAAAARAADVPLAVAQGDGPREQVPIAMFAVMTFIPGVLATVFAWFLRTRAGGAAVFVVASAVLTVLSMVGPVTADATTATQVVLGVSHVVAAVIIVPPIARLLPRRS